MAPAFCYTQVDLARPLKTYSLHNQHKNIKLWMDVNVLLYNNNNDHQDHEKLNTAAFIQPFIRFACKVG